MSGYSILSSLFLFCFHSFIPCLSKNQPWQWVITAHFCNHMACYNISLSIPSGQSRLDLGARAVWHVDLQWRTLQFRFYSSSCCYCHRQVNIKPTSLHSFSQFFHCWHQRARRSLITLTLLVAATQHKVHCDLNNKMSLAASLFQWI